MNFISVNSLAYVRESLHLLDASDMGLMSRTSSEKGEYDSLIASIGNKADG